MGVVRDEHPRVTVRLSLGQDSCQTIQEIPSIPVVYEYLSTLYPPDHDVMQHTGRVQPRLSWHGISLPQNKAHRQLIFLLALYIQHTIEKYIKGVAFTAKYCIIVVKDLIFSDVTYRYIAYYQCDDISHFRVILI